MDSVHKLELSFHPTDLGKLPESIGKHPLFTGEKPVAIMTPDSPKFPAKETGHEAFLSKLKEMGLEYQPAPGKYGGTQENSYFILNPTRQQIFQLGHDFGQESVVDSRNGHRELLYTNGENMGKALHANPTFHFYPGAAPDDNYTTMPGGHVSLNFDWDKDPQETEFAPVQIQHERVHDVQTPGKPIKKSEALVDLTYFRKSLAQTLRDAASKAGYQIPENQKMDAATNDFQNRGSVGQSPEALGRSIAIAKSNQDKAANLNTEGFLRKSGGTVVSDKEFSLDEVRKALADSMKSRIDSYTDQLVTLRQRELKKNASMGYGMTGPGMPPPPAPQPLAKTKMCLSCKKVHGRLEKCGEMLPIKKEEKKAASARAVDDETLAGAKTTKESPPQKIVDAGEGGEELPVKKMETPKDLHKADDSWTSADGLSIPRGGADRKAWDSKFDAAVRQHFGEGKKVRVSVDKLIPGNAPKNSERLRLYTEMARGGGALPPIVVRAHHGGGWEILDGSHRHAAARAAGLKDMDALEVKKSEDAELEHIIGMKNLGPHPSPYKPVIYHTPQGGTSHDRNQAHRFKSKKEAEATIAHLRLRGHKEPGDIWAEPAGKIQKADVPMAPAPTKAGSASHPQSKAGSPKVGAAPAAPMAKSVKIPGRPLKKKADLWNPEEAAPKPKPVVAAPIAAPKAAAQVDFTPAAAAAPQQGKASSEPLKPVGTSALPKPGVLDRFRQALRGGSLGKSEDLMKTAPPGFSEETMHELKAKHGVESAFKIAWAAHNKKHGKAAK